MGMMLRRHFVAEKPVKPVEQTKPDTNEMPVIEIEQAAVAEVIEEPEKESKTVRHTTTTERKRVGRPPAKRK